MGRVRPIQESTTMTYATTTELLTRFDAVEIAQRADRGIPRLVSADLLTAVASNGDLSAWTADEVARAGVALIVIGRALKDADDAINSYVSSRYSLPLTPVPPVLQRVACDLARYFLYDDQVTEVIQKRYDACIKLLADVAAGRVSLGSDDATGSQPTTSSAPELTTSARVWARSSAKGFI